MLLLFLYACVEQPCPDSESLCDDQCIPHVESTTEAIYDNVLSKSCAFSSCHGENAAGQLRLANREDLETMIGASSSQDPQKMLIVPSAPEESYLMHKLYGENLVSGTDRMPPGVPLCESKITAIANWIEAL